MMDSQKSRKKVREKYTFYIPPPARKLVPQEEAVTKEVEEQNKGDGKKKSQSNTEEIKKEKSDNVPSDLLGGSLTNKKKTSVNSCVKSEGSRGVSKQKSINKNNCCDSRNRGSPVVLDCANDILCDSFTDKLNLDERLKELVKIDNNHNKCKEQDRNVSNLGSQIKNHPIGETDSSANSSDDCVNHSQCSRVDEQAFRNVWDTLMGVRESSVTAPDASTNKTLVRINSSSKRREIKELDENCIIEIYGFPVEFKTRDLLSIFSAYLNRGFQMRWVDDTHALGIFISHATAYEVLNTDLPSVQTRALHLATTPSKEKAKQLMPPPPPPRPKTCSASARRLVSGALGIRAVFTPAEIQAEKELLKVAREERTLAAKQRESS